MKTCQNESGLTLLEVLLSIVILSIILVSVVNFFPQMGLMNKKNIDKQQAINTAKEILFGYQSDPDISELISNPITTDRYEIIERTVDFNYFQDKVENNGYSVQFKLKTQADIGSSSGNNLYQIHILLFNKKGTLITETYGYITHN